MHKKYNITVQVLALSATICLSAVTSYALSDQKETAVGRQLDRTLKKQYGSFENPQIQKYVEHIGLKIVSISDRQDIVYHFVILNTDKINSMATAGGYVYITKGLLSRLISEAELAAVLASEIVHIARRHNIDQIERVMKFDDANKRITSEKEALMRSAGAAYAFAKYGYGRKLQTDADIRGVEYLLRVNYDTEAMASFLNIIQVEEKQHLDLVSDFIRGHSSKTTKRIDTVRQMQANLKAADPNKYNSVNGNFYPERYKENVLDVFAAGGIK